MWTGGVRVIVPNHKGEVLMVKQRHEQRELWVLPGGGVEENETTLEAAKREVFEETGIKTEVKRLVWYREEVGERGQRFVNFFLTHPVNEEPILGTDPEFDEKNQILRDVRFVKVSEINKLQNIYPDFLKNELPEIFKKDETSNPYKEKVKLIKK